MPKSQPFKADTVKYHPGHIDAGLKWLHKYRQSEIDAGRNPLGPPTLMQPAKPEKSTATAQEEQKQYQNSFCLKCRKGVDHTVEEEKEMPNGALRRTGSCPYCGTRVHRFTSKGS